MSDLQIMYSNLSWFFFRSNLKTMGKKKGLENTSKPFLKRLKLSFNIPDSEKELKDH